IPLPTRSQIGDGDAVVGVLDRKRSREKPLDLRYGLIRLGCPRIDQSKKSLHFGALDHVAGDWFQLHGATSFSQRVRLSSQQSIKKTELRTPNSVLWTVQDYSFQTRTRRFKAGLRLCRVATNDIHA